MIYDDVQGNAIDEFESCALHVFLKHHQVFDEKGFSLSSEDFYYTDNASIFEVMKKCFEENNCIEIAVMQDMLGKRRLAKKKLRDIFSEGHGYKNNIDVYIQKILENSKHFNTLNKLESIRNNIIARPETREDKLSELINTLDKINTRNNNNNYEWTLSDGLVGMLDDAYNQNYITTGYPELDGFLGGGYGFTNSDLMIISARPSIGKTALALDMAIRLSEKGLRTLFFSTEMKKESLTTRVLSNITRENFFKHKYSKNKLIDSSESLLDLDDKIIIIDKPSINPNFVKAVVENQSKRRKIDLVIVDYIQNMRPNRVTNSKYNDTSEIARDMKENQLHFGIPFVCLSQQSRESDSNASGEFPKPRLSDLRDSGKIEEAADIVMFLYKKNEHAEERELIIRKNRNGSLTRNNDLLYDFRSDIFKFYYKGAK